MRLSAVFLSFFILSSTLISNSANAADGSSGCGPGWYIVKDNSLVSSALRAITNSILFPVSTIGMTFGTSNCSQHKLVQKEKESLHFMTHNYYEIKAETARGEGAYLQAYAHTIGCSAKGQTRFNSQMKNRYREVFANPKVSPEDALTQTYVTILSDSELARECDAT
jgi:hypothetical protein